MYKYYCVGDDVKARIETTLIFSGNAELLKSVGTKFMILSVKY